MKNLASCLSFIFFLVISCFLPQSHSKRQGEALYHLQKLKLPENSSINISDFKSIKHITENVKDPMQCGLKASDTIFQLPGQPCVSLTQYGGHVTVNVTTESALFYYFVEAEPSENSAPLLLWLNGGPGCSSLGYGAMQELGPFRVQSNGELSLNEFAWNKVANVLFLETPVGVGFSYSNKSSEFEMGGDRKTVEENYNFLTNWFERFPEYKTRDFYISGESYAGYYAPQLAQKIIYQNKIREANKTIINLRGIVIGNAAINYETDDRGLYENLASHGIISDEINDEIQTQCDFSPDATSQSYRCNAAVVESYKDSVDIDIYNIYGPLCSSSNNGTTKPGSNTDCVQFDPCSDNYVYAYLNRRDVQEAFHANITNIKNNWQICNYVIMEKWPDGASTSLPIIKELIENKLRVWIYSGDVDGRVPVISTKNSIKKMNLTVENAWRPWYYNKEIAGYVVEYKGLTFATVREAGHQVPSYQPGRSLSLITHFLEGTPLSNNSKYD